MSSRSRVKMCMMNDITKYCQCARAEQAAIYKKIKTGGNDPTISQRMRYSQMVGYDKYRTVIG